MCGLTLVVLAAGIGSRYGGLKQIEPVGPHGEWIVDYSLVDALRAGFDRVVFVVRSEIEVAFRERFGANLHARCQTTYVVQSQDDLPAGYEPPPDRTKPWGTAHAVYACRHAVDGPFAVINADDFYGRSAYQAVAGFLRTGDDREDRGRYCLVGYALQNTLSEHGRVARGICTVDPAGLLTGIEERTAIEPWDGGARFTDDGQTWTVIPGDTVVSMNLWGFTQGLFGELASRFLRFLAASAANPVRSEFLLPEVVRLLISEKRATVRVLPANERWFGVTYRQDQPRVEKAIRDLVDRGVYPERLW